MSVMRFVSVAMFSLFLMPMALAQECVVLLHGLSRTDNSLLILQESLRAFDYKVINNGYPSNDAPIGELTGYVDSAVAECGPAPRLHFVSHSMGGILIRLWLSKHQPQNLGRVVMLGPPNHGSELIDVFGELNLFEYFNGPAAKQLGTGPDSLPNRLGPAKFELGVIAGERAINPLLAKIFPGPNDGKVSVDSTRLDGMSDHIVLPTTHTFMMNNPLVIAQTITFLRQGRFAHELTLGQLLRRGLDGQQHQPQ